MRHAAFLWAQMEEAENKASQYGITITKLIYYLLINSLDERSAFIEN
jgi:hypothetical protein